MANSVNIFTIDATTAASKQFPLNFTLGYLSQLHISAFVVDEVDGAGDQIFRAVTFINDALVQLSGTFEVGDIVHVLRTTPFNVLFHDFQAGAIINELDLDEANLQSLMLIHEVFDGRNIAEFTQDLNMNLFNINNAGVINATSLILGGTAITPSNLTATQVQSQTLTDGQLAVIFTADLAFAAVYVTGPGADNGRLVNGTDFTVATATSTITLTESYPAGTVITVVYNDSGVATRSATATTAQLADLAAEINTSNKLAGVTVFNTTTGKPVWAVGSTAASVWNNATGTTEHTPV
jgi:hypothetical protein